MGFFFVLHGLPVYYYFVLVVLDQGLDGVLLVFGSEGTDDGVALEVYLFPCELILAFLIDEILIELHPHSNAIFLQDARGSQVRNEVYLLEGRWLKQFVISP